jgi:hypothetical protein
MYAPAPGSACTDLRGAFVSRVGSIERSSGAITMDGPDHCSSCAFPDRIEAYCVSGITAIIAANRAKSSGLLVSRCEIR